MDLTLPRTSPESPLDHTAMLLVGHPNVGKSVLFHRLTGTYVNVSNYPGTTVEVSRATARFDRALSLLDTPGVLSLPGRSDDERATMRALLHEELRLAVQVGDAKNLRRTLTLTALLAELGVPMVLALNMSDEASARGVAVDHKALSEVLRIPVVPTIATGGSGMQPLIDALDVAKAPAPLLHYDTDTEAVVQEATALVEELAPHPRLASRGLAILFLGGDSEVEQWLQEKSGDDYARLVALRCAADAASSEALAARLAAERGRAADALTKTVMDQSARLRRPMAQRVGQLAVHRLWGWPILLAVLYVVYELVGVFGAETLVGLFEEQLFGEVLNPAVTDFFNRIFGAGWFTDLFVGQYGLWTMGMTYALALILPIVTTFFLAFGVLEDSGYFSRLSVIANRMFAMLGLNGRAVLPMVLGLGCVTMATLTTRILHTRRERLITTFLMALAIPCSAQLGVVLGLLGGMTFAGTVIWAVTILFVLLFTGWLAGKLVKGRRIPLVTELPPMRLPVLGNVLKKTGGRLKWYLIEVIPLFLLGTFIMYMLDRLGILPWIIRAGEPLVTGWLGLPPEASAAFVMGFLRRDFGATGLFALSSQLSAEQAVVGMVTLTLFIPCIASMMMIIKEQGARTAALMVGMIVPTAFLVGGILHQLLRIFW
ncbi:MAG: ferrous iron transport protein B [Rhodocyclaceae bacterium]|nr:ferrous iron transport protein B [Rhodocyclaceae bacterium]MCB1911817.1 ferrous iron transport protein B [Rhodocyclaceae bacterium]